MKQYEIAARFLGLQFLKLSFTITEKKMAKPKKVWIEITDSHGIGYAAGKKYEVMPDEAKKLISAKKAKPVTKAKTENAAMKSTKIETR